MKNQHEPQSNLSQSNRVSCKKFFLTVIMIEFKILTNCIVRTSNKHQLV